jgi:hypothetical protein
VSCLFVVVNEGPADTLLIGFPDYWPDTQDDSTIGDGASALRDLLIMVDGETIIPEAKPVISAPAGSWNQAHVWTCTFAPGQTRVLRTEYRHVYSYTTSSSHVIDYVLKDRRHLGRPHWPRRTSHQARRPAPEGARLPVQLGLTPTASTTLRATNLEPTRDIYIGMGSPRRYTDHIMGTWRYLHGTDDALREIRESVYMNGSTPEVPG